MFRLLLAGLGLAPMLLLLLMREAGSAAPRSDEEEQDLVAVELVADFDELRPGERFFVGLRFTIEPGWHVYWENPGDSGVPTRAELALPEGFEVGPLLFPGPERFESPGDIVSFGHSGAPVFLIQVVAPSDLEAGREIELGAKVRWLVCKEACYLGSAEPVLRLRTAAAGGPPRPKGRLEAARARLPRPFAELEGGALRWEGTRTQPVLCVDLPAGLPAELSFFPADEPGLELASEKLEKQSDGRRVLRRSYDFRSRTESEHPRVRAVIGLGPPAERRFHALELAWPPRESIPGEGKGR